MASATVTSSLLGSLANAATEVVQRLQRSVVVVRGGPRGGGAGTIWHEDGLILTSSHVVPGNRAEIVSWDDRVYPAELVAREPRRDLAALRVAARDLPAVEVGDSDRLRVGQLVLAVGNPWGERGAVAAGIILSTTGATVENGVSLPEAIRADVRLAPGNSGGPLADASGRVIGINAMIVGGMAVAVPSNTVARFLAGAYNRGFIGISAVPAPLPPAIAAAFGVSDGSGLLLTEVADGSPAARAGLLPGDLLVGLDGAGCGLRAVAQGLRALRPGTPVRLVLLRGGTPCEVAVMPAAPGACVRSQVT